MLVDQGLFWTTSDYLQRKVVYLILGAKVLILIWVWFPTLGPI